MRDPNKNEISAIQSLMNWRFHNLNGYLSEGENRPRKRSDSTSLTLTPEEIKTKQTKIPRNQLSIQWTNLVAFIDVQDEILFYGILAHDQDFNGQFVDYGTFPEITSKYFHKNQISGWSTLTRWYYKHHKDDKNKPSHIQRDKTTSHRAPFDAKMYFALQSCCNFLLSREFTGQDNPDYVRKIRALAIDTKWGEASGVIKRFVREFNDPRVKCYEGHPFPPTVKQLETWTPTAGWLFEHNQFPHLQEARWVIKPYNKTGYHQEYILSDVNRWKSFLTKRLGAPLGSSGSISLFHTPKTPDDHLLFAMHCTSEYPEPVTAAGITKDMWMEKQGRKGENDYLDVATGCMCLASICGASVKTSEQKAEIPREKTLSEIYKINRPAKSR